LLGEAVASGRAAMVLSDDDLNYIAANDAACVLLGYDRSELLALRVSDVVPKPHATLTARSRQIAGGRSRQGRTTVRRRDGSDLEIEYVSFASKVAGLPYVLTVFWPRE
jgi:PAS domain S-box-containing protein